MKKIKNIDKTIYFLSIAIYIGYIFYVYSAMDETRLAKIFNSDALYLPVFFQDIFIDKTGLSGLRFNGQPNFFPDMLIYFPIYAITKNFMITAFLYSVIQNVIIIFLIYQITKLIIKDFSFIYPAFINFLFILIYNTGIFGTFVNMRFHLICNGYHTSAFILALTGFILMLYYFKTEKKLYFWLITFLVILGTLNDKLFVLEFVIPAFIVNVYLVLKNTTKKVYILLIVNIVLSSVIGHLIYRGIILYTPWSFIPQDFGITSEKMKFSIDFAAKFLSGQLKKFEFYSAILLIGYISHLLCLFISIKDFFKKSDTKVTYFTVYCVFSITFFVFVYFTPIITGSFIYISIFRYVVFVFYFGLISFGILISTIKKIKIIKTTTFVLLFATLSMLISQSIKAKMFSSLSTNLKYKPEYVENLEKIAEKHTDLKLGVSHYWKARQSTMFNDKGLKIYATFYPKLNPELWTSSNRYWYFQKDENSEIPIFNFIVLQNDEDTIKFADFFGIENIEFIKEGNISIIKTPDFKYIEETKQAQIIEND